MSRDSAAGSSPNHSGHTSGLRTTGIRSWSSAHSSFGIVVTMAKLRTHSPAGERRTDTRCSGRERMLSSHPTTQPYDLDASAAGPDKLTVPGWISLGIVDRR